MTDTPTPQGSDTPALPEPVWINSYGFTANQMRALMAERDAAREELEQAAGLALASIEIGSKLTEERDALRREVEARWQPLYSTRENAARWLWWKPWIERRVGDLAPYEAQRRASSPKPVSAQGDEIEARWQAIATAPRDGPVLVYGQWAGEIGGIDPQGPSIGVAAHCDRSDYPGFKWYDVNADAYAAWWKPTHWMPIPAPPSGITSADGGER